MGTNVFVLKYVKFFPKPFYVGMLTVSEYTDTSKDKRMLQINSDNRESF